MIFFAQRRILTLSKTKRGKRPFRSKQINHSNVQMFGSDFESRIAQHANRLSPLKTKNLLEKNPFETQKM